MFEVLDEWDGCLGERVYFQGTREECLAWMRRYWGYWEKKLGWRGIDWCDGFILVDKATGRAVSFML